MPHRIDRGTSGIVLFSKTRHIHPAVSALFAEGKIEKTYRALCAYSAISGSETRPPEGSTWIVENQLEPTLSRGRKRQRAVSEGGKRARTRFRILATHGDAASVEAHPFTGRFHQIRVHLADQGMPILGDRLYGYPGRIRRWADRPMLHANTLAFVHPVDRTRIEINSPLPEDFLAVERALIASV